MNVKIKRILKKALLSTAGAFMLICSLTTSAFALTGTTSSIKYKDWILIDPTDNSQHGTEGYLHVNNEPVFCVDYYTTFHSGKTVVAGDFNDIGISEAKAKRLSLIAYFGTKVQGRTGRDWYAITQGLLWREIHGVDNLEYVSNPTTPDYASAQRAWSQILTDVERYYIAPSFTTSSHLVDADRSIELNDTNGVLEDMVVVNNGGLDVSIHDNKLIINGNSNVDDATIVLRKNIAASETGTSIVYTAKDCQSTASFKVSDPMQVSFKVKVNQFGKLELTKYNEDKSGTVVDTTYQITGPNGFNETHTTNADGKILLDRLAIGEYKAVEVQAGTGYLIDTNEFGFTIKANETTKVNPTNIEPTGKIELKKSIDTSRTNGFDGDAVADGNVYGLYAKDKIMNKAGTKVFYQKDELVSKKTTDHDGKITWDNLPLGNYYIKELESNDGLVLNNQIVDVSIEYQGQTIQKVIKTRNTNNRVNMQKIRVFKSGEKDGISGIVKGLQGAEFTFKLKSEVNHVGWDNAKTYAKVTTDENGYASTEYMPYGEYLVKETFTPENYITAPDFTISITDDYTEYKDVEQIKTVNINNRPFTAQLKLVKVDKDTGERVTLNSASFKIKDSKGNYVTQKIAAQKYDTFTTNSKNQVTVLFGHKGEVTLPLALDAGTYTIEEIKIPDGFLKLEKPIKFTITNQYNYDLDEDEEPILTVEIENEQPKGKIILTKTDKETNKAMENVEYVLTAKETIYSAVDGTVLFEKGNIVAKGKTDINGQIIIDELFMGQYELRETLTNVGYVLSEEVHDIEFKAEDTSTKQYTIEINETNIAPTAEIHLVKSDKDTGELLSGVIYQLTAKEDIYSLDGRHQLLYKAGDTVSTDISQNGQYMTNELGEIHIAKLPLGKYALKEIKALDGYATDKQVYEIDLTYDGSEKTIYTKQFDLTNTKTAIEISKTDISTSKELVGAKLTLLDENNEMIETWTSTEQSHIITGLQVGRKYILHEDLVPLGYVKANDITFTVEDTDKVQKIEMIDEIIKVEISKQDITNGKELEGAKLQIINSDNKVVHEWVTGNQPHIFEKLPAGEYILREITAPSGYEIAEDISFTVNETSEIQKVIMKDQPIKVTVITGDSTHLMLYIGLFILAGAYFITLLKKKKHNHE